MVHDPTREQEALEWILAGVMMLVRDGLMVRLTGYLMPDPALVVGELEGFHWWAAHTFDIPRGAVLEGFEARTPEGLLVGDGPVRQEDFSKYHATYALRLDLDFSLLPLKAYR
jgi:hypothetical protein